MKNLNKNYVVVNNFIERKMDKIFINFFKNNKKSWKIF
jgi:hypothetical protein